MKFSLTKSEVNTLNTVSKTEMFKTGFNFLKAHNGLREEKMHLFMASTGAGKSTLTRSLILDCLKNNADKNILLVVSEESIDDVKAEFSRTDLIDIEKPNLFIIAEQTYPEENFLLRLGEYIKNNNIHVMIYDNITTSFLYNDKKASEQFKIAKELKKITQHNFLVSILIAHTNAEINDNCSRLINENDIRGSKSIVNLVEFLYIMQRFELSGHFYPTIRIKKHRSQDPDDKMFRLVYNKATKLYQSDLKITFKEFKEAYDGRDKL